LVDLRDRKRTLVDEIYKEKFNPYSDAFMTTMFFYRYDGSITEPPCKDITWWVMKDPMYIDFAQLDQLREIMFTHVDRNCQKTSVHNEEQSVARPIQALGDRIIEFCKEGDFRSDASKGRPEAKQCRLAPP
jgi:carbonic anhydrase